MAVSLDAAQRRRSAPATEASPSPQRTDHGTSPGAVASTRLNLRLGNQGVQRALESGGDAVSQRLCRALAGMTPPETSNRRAMRHLMDAGEHAALQQATETQGEALPDAVRERMERAMGHDFSHVRIHRDGAAQRAAEALNAHAFALGAEIFFGSGTFAPGTAKGDRLLAHELTHVIQHDEGRLHGTGVSDPSDPAEREAYRNEDVVLRSLAAPDTSTEPEPGIGPVVQPNAAAETVRDTAQDSAEEAPAMRAGEPNAKRPRIEAEDAEMAPAEPVRSDEEIEQLARDLTEAIAVAVTALEAHPAFEGDFVFAERAMHYVDMTIELLDGVDTADVVRRDQHEAFAGAVQNQVTAAGELVALLNAARELDRQGQQGRAGERDALKRRIVEGYAYLQGIYFVPTGGGFGAKGRAHALGEEEDPERDSPWINEGFQEMGPGTVHVEMGREDQPARGTNTLKTGTAESFAQRMRGRVAEAQDGDFQRLPNRVDRGRGQGFEMGGNARSFANLVLGQGPADATDWEWLHLRASSLSGVTAPSNLVLGTRDANTWMIPFESHIKGLASLRVPVRLTVEPREPVPVAEFVGLSEDADGAALDGHAFRRVDFAWQVGEEAHNMVVRPLAWDRQAISKEEIEQVETFLKAERDQHGEPEVQAERPRKRKGAPE